ncbi:MAG: hypothetical protein ACRCSQ_03805 [Bacteroidales bacterium]
MDIHKIIAEGGMTFKKGKEETISDEKRIKTKAKKSTYAKGTHGSASAKMKADYKKKKALRNKRSV